MVFFIVAIRPRRRSQVAPARRGAGDGIWWMRAAGRFCCVMMGDGFRSPSVVAQVGGVLHVSGDSKRSPESPTCSGVSRVQPRRNAETQRIETRTATHQRVGYFSFSTTAKEGVSLSSERERSHMFRSCEPSWWRWRCSGWAASRRAPANHSARRQTRHRDRRSHGGSSIPDVLPTCKMLGPKGVILERTCMGEKESNVHYK